jgi:hypothetical protein
MLKIVKSASAKDIKSWRDDRVGIRSGEKIYNVLREPTTIFPECGKNRPILLVTNPDIFYYATFFAYYKLDRDIEPERQNLDWLIFSTRDRFAFWQRIGRVGRVLGKKQTNIPSSAIANFSSDNLR